MNISNIFEQKKVVFSLEVFPPKKTSSIETIYSTLADIKSVPADFVSVTYGAGGTEIQKNKTCEIASLLKTEYNVEPLSHLTCISSLREEVKAQIEKLKENDITNILALRGDENPDIEKKNDFRHASDLVRFIKEIDSEINIAGACYPERHCESKSAAEDIKNLKIKVEAGVSHLITQLFLDNNAFYEFMEKTQIANINVPVEAGIMPIINKSQIERTVSMCGASLPHKFSAMVNRYSNDPEALKDAGIAYATDQIIDLIANGVRGIHLYTMNNIEVARRIYSNISNILTSVNKQ